MLGVEEDHLCLSGLQPLVTCVLDAGSDSLQPLLLGLLKLQECSRLGPALGWLAGLGLWLGCFILLPWLSFILGRLAVSSIPDAAKALLRKEPLVGFLLVRGRRPAT